MADELKGKTVSVIGLGARTGTSLVRFLCEAGARVRAYDAKPRNELSAGLEAVEGLEFELEAGRPEPTDLAASDLILVSPGVPADAPYLERARRAGKTVWGEVEFAARRLTSPIVAVTGSNGKSTTTSLVGHILTAWGKRVFVGGNLGTPLIESVGQRLDFVVAEISSFQLETVDLFRPHVGLLLNLSPNHLDRHRDMATYGGLKERMFSRMKGEDLAVLNADDETCRNIGDRLNCTVRWFAGRAAEGIQAAAAGGEIRFRDGRVISLGKFRLIGRHNAQNAAAAALTVRSLGCPPETIEKALATFRALPHRLEPVAEIRGVRFINDSKSTTPGAGVCALEAFGEPVILLAGGKSKGASYAPLAEAVKAHAKFTHLFGPAAGPMSEAFKGIPHSVHGRLEEAFEAAAKTARPGDVVLLSPANTSFDQFRDFEERGETFGALVHKRLREAGE